MSGVLAYSPSSKGPCLLFEQLLASAAVAHDPEDERL